MTTAPILLTASWRAMADRHAAGDRSYVPVRISLGCPRFWPLAASVPYVPELAPGGLLHVEPWDEFTRRYVERLDRIGVDAIRGRLERIHQAYGRPLVLLCFEPDRVDCHRSIAAAWLEQHGLGAVHEVDSPDVQTAKPAHNAHSHPSGQLSAQLSLDGSEDR
ncbi:MAG: DUF488 family protein [Solirubrobacteraceae bacterium]